MESQARKPYTPPAIRPATPEEVERFDAAVDDEPARDTWPEAFVCNGCSRALPNSEMAPDSRDETSLGALCTECAECVR